MNICIMIFLILSLSVSCTKKVAEPESVVTISPSSPKVEEGKKVCSDHQYCAGLRGFERKCRTSLKEVDCLKFVQLFEKLSVINDCQGNFDTGAVPSIWICDEDSEESSYPKLFERAARTLSVLKFSFAKEFYRSNEFRSTLDGEVAEEHFK